MAQRDISNRNAPLKHLGFLVDEDFFNDFEVLYEFGKDLGLQPKNLKIFTFLETKRKIPSLRQNQITNKEFSWRGEIQNQAARDFLNFPFDALIGYYNANHDYLRAMAALSNAKFKIGFSNEDKPIYDLLLVVDLQNTELFKAELRKYLHLFGKI